MVRIIFELGLDSRNATEDPNIWTAANFVTSTVKMCSSTIQPNQNSLFYRRSSQTSQSKPNGLKFGRRIPKLDDSEKIFPLSCKRTDYKNY